MVLPLMATQGREDSNPGGVRHIYIYSDKEEKGRGGGNQVLVEARLLKHKRWPTGMMSDRWKGSN